MVRRAAVLCIIGGCAIVPAAAMAAGPAWHPPTYPSTPKAGAPSDFGVPLALGAGGNGRATLLYGAVKGNLYAYSRTSAGGAWGSGRLWRKSAAIRPTSELAIADGRRVTALWTGREGNLFTSTGSQRAGGGQSFLTNAAATPAIAAVPQGVAYAYARGGTAGASVLGGASPAQRKLRAASTIAAFPGTTAPGVQSGVDAAGNQTLAWPQSGMLMVSSRPAGSSAWSPPAALPGSSGGPFGLGVAPSGAAVIGYQANVQNASFTGISPVDGQPATLPYQAEASVVAVQRPANGAPFGPPQIVHTYKPPTPTSIESVPDGEFPTAVTAATNGSTAVVGIVDTTTDTPLFRLTRGGQIGAFPAPTSVTDPYVPNQETTTWGLVDLASAIDRGGNAVIAVGGSTTQGEPDSVIASTSTSASPAWRRGRDVADCPKRPNTSEGIASGPDAVVSPAGGVVLGWACQSAETGSTRGTIGVASFDALGPPVVSFRASGTRMTFTLGETARYTLTATKGGRRVRGGGRAVAGRAINRTLRLSSGRWKVTLRATLPSGNTTVRSETTRVP